MGDHAPFFFCMTLRLRNAGVDDVQAIRWIADRGYQRYAAVLGKKPAPMVADFKKHVQEDWVIVVEQGNVLVGYAVLLLRGSSALLDNIAVDIGVQRQGVGKALIDHIEQHLLRLGHDRYELYTNAAMTENISWYARLGFVETRRVEEHGFKRVYMQKQLSSPE